VDALGPGLEALVEDMFASMYAANGVGLAANQIGAGLRVFVYDCPDSSGENQAGHVVNPAGLPGRRRGTADRSRPGKRAI
jgi:peptide deformylase